MKRAIVVFLVLVLTMPSLASARPISWDDWYEGDVQIRIWPSCGEGGFIQHGESISIEMRLNEDAYVMVYAIDTDGYVKLLYPRFWQDDGWVPAQRTVYLNARDLAWPTHNWGSDGTVFVEAIASPTPFHWRALGIFREADTCAWFVDDRPLRVHGDPLLAFNEIHQRIFVNWETATFAADYTYFDVGRPHVYPRYFCGNCEVVYAAPYYPRFSPSWSVVWHFERGPRYGRPYYTAYYVPWGGQRYVVRKWDHDRFEDKKKRTRQYVIHDTRRERTPTVQRRVKFEESIRERKESRSRSVPEDRDGVVRRKRPSENAKYFTSEPRQPAAAVDDVQKKRETRSVEPEGGSGVRSRKESVGEVRTKREAAPVSPKKETDPVTRKKEAVRVSPKREAAPATPERKIEEAKPKEKKPAVETKRKTERKADPSEKKPDPKEEKKKPKPN